MSNHLILNFVWILTQIKKIKGANMEQETTELENYNVHDINHNDVYYFGSVHILCNK